MATSDNQINFLKNQTNKCRILQENYCKLPDEILEIQQIEYEQRLIREEINRIDTEKQQLQDLLNLLQASKINSKTKNIKNQQQQQQQPHVRHRLDSIDSNSESD